MKLSKLSKGHIYNKTNKNNSFHVKIILLLRSTFVVRNTEGRKMQRITPRLGTGSLNVIRSSADCSNFIILVKLGVISQW